MKIWFAFAILFLVCLSGLIFVSPLYATETSVECECVIHNGPDEIYGEFKYQYVMGQPVRFCMSKLCYIEL